MDGSLQAPADDRGPLFTVALPAYNAETTLAAAVESVKSQTLDDWELIVVDDGSTDATRAIAQSFADSDRRIRVISQSNAGCGAARNTAIQAARAEWIVRLDADDILLPCFLERIREVIAEHPEAEIVTPTGLRRYPDGHEEIWCPDPRYRQPLSLTLEDALHGWCPVFTHSAFRKSLWKRIGGIRLHGFAEDYDFWVRALAAGAKAWFFPEPLSVYDSGTSSQMTARTNPIAETYLDTLEHLVDSASLAPPEEVAVRRRIGQLRRRVAFRRTTTRLLGEQSSERVTGAIVRLVNWYRGQRSRHSER